ncbi:ABC transporter permease [Clostridium estertheticum]|uniref:Sugar ABC transporter permease n=2 Tax=Clostridium estertheticum TaxID=238834 RepID=A0A1J0GDD2_9CLOT|nr:ABC transporter permease subunit [Clostridium estertheticum]APC39341.1 sugar ABC transporter permease [Clostridium estertheticum subsp. estertheticum]MBZ9614642.1 ABC transporter permease subunit [Clostridium estertheticum subsp. laramiense]MCB2339182.1 ABC transporter permease subunit [Clostridium estertheticum]MCB2360086.1 ABC transporter permease subunit [Clostridium estertheticum]NNU77495.1 sugar ABC transporter permease [Clostridium estertheticum]
MENTSFLHKVKKNKTLLLMLLPAVLFFFIFSYLPIAGIVVAFKSYNFKGGIFGSPWVGLDNFKFFFMSGQAFIVTRNTVLYNLAFIFVNTVLQIAMAIFLSEIKNKYFKKITQSLMFLPYFISWVIVGVISYNIFSFEHGTFNSVLKFFHIAAIDMYSKPLAWIVIIIIFCAWQGLGYGTVLYLAAIMGIDTEIYEAAEIDGANIFERIRYITLPSLVPTITILTLLAVGTIFRGNFDMFYQIIGNNGTLFNATDVIDTFTVRALLQTNEVGMAAAAGLYQSVFCFITIMVVNTAVKKHDEDNALF